LTQRDVKSVLDRVLTWSKEDREELAEVAREIESVAYRRVSADYR
jgi:hypothetical protein